VISRQWRGLAHASCAEAYVDHLRQETFPAIAKLPGFISASILRRTLPEGVEFLIVTHWESIDSIRAFAGTDVEHAVVPQKVQEMMADYDRSVRHFEIVE
jgi:heme-degrading monooxygenase HmoA